MKEGFIYIISNQSNSTLYIGVTNNLQRRLIEHKNGINPNSFSAKYNLNKLVYYEYFENIEDAISREKQLKKWNRNKKDNLISSLNPDLKDLYEALF